MYLTTYLDVLRGAECTLADGCRLVSDRHRDDAAVHFTLARFADQCIDHADALDAARARSDSTPAEASLDRAHPTGLDGTRSGPLGLLRDLVDLYQLASLVDVSWTLVGQAARGARDRELIALADQCAADTATQLGWLMMIMKSAAPQTLLVAR